MRWNKLIELIVNKRERFETLTRRGFYNYLPDEIFLRKSFKIRMGYALNLQNPQTFNEKLQWLKINDRKPIYTTMVDKYDVKAYVAEQIGEEYIIPTFGVWDAFDEIDFDALPNQFVLKCTHDSGGRVICRDKSQLNLIAAKEKINTSLRRNYYKLSREWPYKDVKPRIIAEQYMTDSPDSNDFTDYKFFCFDGKVDCVMVCLERSSGDTKFYFFDRDWNLKRLNIRGKNAPKGFTIPKPECMDEMFEIAAKLSQGVSYLRVDLYQSNGRVYFGELTFFPQSGFDANLLPETDEYFGRLLQLPKKQA